MGFNYEKYKDLVECIDYLSSKLKEQDSIEKIWYYILRRKVDLL